MKFRYTNMSHIDEELMRIFDYKVNELEESKIKDIFLLMKRMLINLDMDQIEFKKELHKEFNVPLNRVVDLDECDDKKEQQTDVDYSKDNDTSLDHFVDQLGYQQNENQINDNKQCQEALEEVQKEEKKVFEKLLVFQQEMLKKDRTKEGFDINGMIENEMSQFDSFVEPPNEDDLIGNNLLDAFLQQFDAVQITKDNSKIKQKPFIPQLSSSDDSSDFIETNSNEESLTKDIPIEIPKFTMTERRGTSELVKNTFQCQQINNPSLKSIRISLMEIKRYNENSWAPILYTIDDTFE
ncbi:hypothetical protein EDI_113360 [Entamoeba dispar SAW760]|uniref:Uncharacterized protein n=1 Tax=Entamoeba dispar (strain ATCC PRA-260 / SAW760) TaxID=370354 RepID=B0E5Y3_ENTDS|nr:uncharacterized protein EDI_113360 [Entamoeba dispar SAW760]EDR30101.1 hypothetical protein EDI_113360 [Entamoeba dispar SAW760]|eukprot:EDR30101.1 hypothetical protein EDI_113360 [Entamoeba dispar SAW760]